MQIHRQAQRDTLSAVTLRQIYDVKLYCESLPAATATLVLFSPVLNDNDDNVECEIDFSFCKIWKQSYKMELLIKIFLIKILA